MGIGWPFILVEVFQWVTKKSVTISCERQCREAILGRETEDSKAAKVIE